MHDPKADTLRVQVRQLNALRSRRRLLDAAISDLEQLAETSLEQILRERSTLKVCRRLRVIQDNTAAIVSQLSQ